MKNKLSYKMSSKFILTFLLFFQFAIIGGCETMHRGNSYAVHNDKEAMDFAWFGFNEKNYVVSQRMAEVALNINPGNIDAYNLLGLIALRQNYFDKSINYFEKANEIIQKNNKPYTEYILNNLGYAYYNNQEYEKALEVFEKSFKIRENWLSSFGAAISLYNLGNKDDAVTRIKYCRKELDFESKSREILEYFNISLKDDLIKFIKSNIE